MSIKYQAGQMNDFVTACENGDIKKFMKLFEYLTSGTNKNTFKIVMNVPFQSEYNINGMTLQDHTKHFITMKGFVLILSRRDNKRARHQMIKYLISNKYYPDAKSIYYFCKNNFTDILTRIFTCPLLDTTTADIVLTKLNKRCFWCDVKKIPYNRIAQLNGKMYKNDILAVAPFFLVKRIINYLQITRPDIFVKNLDHNLHEHIYRLHDDDIWSIYIRLFQNLDDNVIKFLFDNTNFLAHLAIRLWYVDHHVGGVSSYIIRDIRTRMYKIDHPFIHFIGTKHTASEFERVYEYIVANKTTDVDTIKQIATCCDISYIIHDASYQIIDKLLDLINEHDLHINIPYKDAEQLFLYIHSNLESHPEQNNYLVKLATPFIKLIMETNINEPYEYSEYVFSVSFENSGQTQPINYYGSKLVLYNVIPFFKSAKKFNSDKCKLTNITLKINQSKKVFDLYIKSCLTSFLNLDELTVPEIFQLMGLLDMLPNTIYSIPNLMELLCTVIYENIISEEISCRGLYESAINNNIFSICSMHQFKYMLFLLHAAEDIYISYTSYKDDIFGVVSSDDIDWAYDNNVTLSTQ
jgi:hypothetical protein